MAYVPHTLKIGRCWRCGKWIHKDDTYYKCPKCNALYCEICYRKTFGKCPACGAPLQEV